MDLAHSQLALVLRITVSFGRGWIFFFFLANLGVSILLETLLFKYLSDAKFSRTLFT